MTTHNNRRRWPSTGRRLRLPDVISGLDRIYERDKPPMCYPGTPIHVELAHMGEALLGMQLNALGTHTHGNWEGDQWLRTSAEGGFERLQEMEAEAIWMIASMVGGDPHTVDGHFCAGGTEANIEGMWIGRNYLRKQVAGGKDGIVIFTTSLVHYSVIKGAEMLGLGKYSFDKCSDCGEEHLFRGPEDGSGVNFVPMNEAGEMDPIKLEEALLAKYRDGFRRFMVIPTVGTTALGSVDDIDLIHQAMERVHQEHSDAHFYMHVDASFGGFTVPFLNPDHGLSFGNHHYYLRSMALDADKMGHLPYPAGILLCAKHEQKRIGRRVNYLGGHHDDTIAGSRSALAPIMAWYWYQNIGVDGHRLYVQRCIDMRNTFIGMLMEVFTPDQVGFFPISPWVNLLPLEIMIENGEVPESIRKGDNLRPYELRSDFFPSDPTDLTSCPRTVYKLCIMPHHRGHHFTSFIGDLKMAFVHH